MIGLSTLFSLLPADVSPQPEAPHVRITRSNHDFAPHPEVLAGLNVTGYWWDQTAGCCSGSRVVPGLPQFGVRAVGCNPEDQSRQRTTELGEAGLEAEDERMGLLSE